MAKIQFPYISNIRFRPNVSQDDIPRIDKMANNVDYQRGIYSNKNYVLDWLFGKEIVFQFRTDVSESAAVGFRVNVVTESGTSQITPTDVTPSGWVSGRVLNVSYTPPSKGNYYFYTIFYGVTLDEHFISDIYRVRDDADDLVEIQYYDTENGYEGVFNNGDDWIWQPIIYFTGQMIPDQPSNEYSMYKNTLGEPRKLKAEPQDSLILTIADVSYLQLKLLNRIFSCDTIFVNGQPVQNQENIKWDGIEKSDLGNVTINLIDTDNDGFVKNY